MNRQPFHGINRFSVMPQFKIELRSIGRTGISNTRNFLACFYTISHLFIELVSMGNQAVVMISVIDNHHFSVFFEPVGIDHDAAMNSLHRLPFRGQEDYPVLI